MDLLRRFGRRVQALPPLAVLAIAWTWLLVYSYPGIMTQDSFDHLREAREGVYADSHPPVINLVWKICDYIIAGPFLMFVLQSVLFLCGLYLLLRKTFVPRRAAWITLCVFIYPPVMMPVAVIWKDNLMAAMLLLGTVGLLSERRGPRIWALFALVGATAFRYNALGATLPLVVLLFEMTPGPIVKPPGWLHRVKRYALSTVTWLAVTVMGFGINAALTDKEMHYWHSSLALYDIVGTLAYVDEDIPDAELAKLLEGTEVLTKSNIHDTIRIVYSPRDFFPIVNDPNHTMWNVPINGYVPAPQSQRDAIGRAWKDTLTTYPVEYAKHRLLVMKEVLGFGDFRGGGAVANRDYRWVEFVHQLGLGTGWSKLQRKLTLKARWLSRHTPMFLPYIYAIAGLILLVLARKQRDVLTLLLSGYGIMGTLLFLAHSNDYRYSHWMVICTIVGGIVLFARWHRAKRGVDGVVIPTT